MSSLSVISDEVRIPRFFRIVSFLTGVLLVGEGMRRFILPAAGGLYGFFPYLLLGLLCVIVAGYRRIFILNDDGLVRRTLVWGKRSDTVLLTWEGTVYAALDTAVFTGILGDGRVRWKINLNGETTSLFREWLQMKRPDIVVS